MVRSEQFINEYKIGAESFTRDRVWTFDTAFFFIASFLNKRVQTEIDCFLSELKQIPKERRIATSSSFTRIRDKISCEAFRAALLRLVSHYYKNYKAKRYCGMRLIAIDGTIATAPINKETIECFGENVLSKKGKWVNTQVSFATDVLSNICVDAEIAEYKANERSLAAGHLPRLGSGNLLLFDRGYFSKDLLEEVSRSENNYLFRVKSDACRDIAGFCKSGGKDFVGEIKIDKISFRVRLTKIKLDSGETEILLSSLLDTDKFKAPALKKLYHMRWGVEEQYKDMKHTILIENFVGRKVNSIKQEFYAAIMMYNISMMTAKPLADEQANKKKKKYEYKTNKKALIAKFKQCYVRLFFGNADLTLLLENIIATITKEAIAVINGRKFARAETFKVKKKHYRPYAMAI